MRNFTDIDDKIINRANELGESTVDLAKRYMDSFTEDMEALGILPATLEPKATEHIAEIIAGIETLIKKGHAYEVDGDVYFAVHSFSGYGKLSGRNLDDMQAGAQGGGGRAQEKPHGLRPVEGLQAGRAFLAQPMGRGAPRLAHRVLGDEPEIPGAHLRHPRRRQGSHLSPIMKTRWPRPRPFPASPLPRYWVHNGFVRVNQEKMSKSLGNFFTIKDILKTVRPEALRLFLLSKHYRSPLDFSDAGAEGGGPGPGKALPRPRRGAKRGNGAGEPDAHLPGGQGIPGRDRQGGGSIRAGPWTTTSTPAAPPAACSPWPS